MLAGATPAWSGFVERNDIFRVPRDTSIAPELVNVFALVLMP